MFNPLSFARSLFLACLSTGLVLLLSSSSFSSSSSIYFVSAQSQNCHSCIKRTVPLVDNCSALTPAQYQTLDKLIHGAKVHENIGVYHREDPKGFDCLVALMWDIVHYKAKLWGACLDPKTACPWGEMMHYFTIIPKIASIYGAQNPPV
ncbi:hypothetical protein BX616_007310, partial [Lobosporangium transversale]